MSLLTSTIQIQSLCKCCSEDEGNCFLCGNKLYVHVVKRDATCTLNPFSQGNSARFHNIKVAQILCGGGTGWVGGRGVCGGAGDFFFWGGMGVAKEIK